MPLCDERVYESNFKVLTTEEYIWTEHLTSWELCCFSGIDLLNPDNRASSGTTEINGFNQME